TEHEISILIRKILQETLPRELNLFFPVISSGKFIGDFLLEQSKNPYIDILIKLKNKNTAKGNVSHKDMCMYLANSTIELYVRENIFLKYQNLLSEPTVDNIKDFYILSSGDSFRFEVFYE
ncbi:hypothetical protein, partial [Rodentibacter trehalosifermentans]|uniref:hypothetical protein n=1 Tax=Rodentibacter trehalosifermentans TaxID=1908263 RepID=UPI0013F69D30